MPNTEQTDTVLRLLLFAVIAAPVGVDSLVYPEYPSNLDKLDLSKAPPNDEQRLLRHIMRSYDRSVRPVYQASSVVTVAVGMTLAHIFNVDEKKQVLSMNIWLEQEWHDERIRWEPVEFGNITQLTVPTKFIWTPDIVLYNNAQDFSHGILQTNVAVYPSGIVLWAPPVKFHSTCKLDVSFFPFDDQICYLHFGSWIYDGSQVDVTNRSDKITIQIDSFTPNGEWEIVATKVSRRINRIQNTLPSANLSYPGLRFTLHLRRRTLYYLYNIIIPCIMLSILTMMQFWLPCESGEKVTLGLTVLLAYSVFSFNIAENMPETSEVIPLVAIYLMCIMGISAVSVTLSVIVLNMRHGGERKHAVPLWLQYLAYRVLGRLICWTREKHGDVDAPENISFQQAFHSLSKQLARHQQQSQMTHIAPPPEVTASQVSPLTQRFASTTSPLKSILRRDPSPMIELCSLARTNSLGNGDLLSAAQLNVPPNSDPLHRRSELSRICVTSSAVDTHASAKSRRRQGLKNDIMRRAGKLMDRIESEQRADEVLHEWRKVSRIFDQFFFCLILFFTGSVTVVLLLVAPRFSKRTLVDF